jgi:hypothetical protein
MSAIYEALVQIIDTLCRIAVALERLAGKDDDNTERRG